jgi:hypothetical protein
VRGTENSFDLDHPRDDADGTSRAVLPAHPREKNEIQVARYKESVVLNNTEHLP